MSIDRCIQCKVPTAYWEKSYGGYCHVCMGIKQDDGYQDYISNLAGKAKRSGSNEEVGCDSDMSDPA